MKTKERLQKVRRCLSSKVWRRTVTALACIVVFCTVYALILPGISMSKSEKVLTCSLSVHQHTEPCYDESGELICGKADFVVHTHDEDCYDGEGYLLCPLEEVSVHEHTDSCYEEETVLICDKAESEAVTETEEEGTIWLEPETAVDAENVTEEADAASEEESAAPETEAETAEPEEDAEAHVHTDECYETVQTLTCGKEEIVLHTHDDSCYNESGELTCGMLEVTEHVHDKNCYTTAEKEDTAPAEDTASGDDIIADDDFSLTEDTILSENTVLDSATVEASLPNCQEIIDINVGDTLTTPTIQAGKCIYYRFTPTETHKYTFQSTGSYNTYSYLYNSSGSQIYSTGNGGTGSNFALTYKLTAGETYYYAAFFSSGSYTGSFDVSLTYATSGHTFTDGVCLCGDKLSDFGGTCGYGTNADNVVWYITDDCTLRIEGTGAMAEYGKNTVPWKNLRDNIEAVEISSGVTTISGYAFYDCEVMKNVTIPDTVTKIGSYAFAYCDKLQEVTIPSSVSTINSWTFYYNYALKRVTLSENITSIDSGAFYCCTSLTEINLPEGLTTIAYNAFWKCSSLNNITLPSSLRTIDQYAFSECSALTEISIPKGVTTIYKYAFHKCTGLEKVTLPDTLTKIDQYAFAYCSALTEITIPDTVTEISSYVFYNCTALKEVTIGKSIAFIGTYAFYGCNALEKVTFSPSCPLKTINEYQFASCYSLKEITIPDSVTSIAKDAFYNCYNLKKATMSNSVTYIGVDAFNCCSSLQELTLSDSLVTISQRAFANCVNLREITIPASVKTIDSAAFYNCIAWELEKFTLETSNLTTCADNIISWSTGSYFSAAKANDDTTKIVISDKVDTLYSTFLSAVNNCGYNDIAFEFVGPNEFYYSGDTVTLNNFNMTEGSYYVTEDGIVFRLNDDMTATLVFYPQSLAVKVDIPASVSVDGTGYTVTDIGDKVFKGYEGLTEITLPKTIKTIGSYAFYNCDGLTEITLPSSVETIGSYAISDCDGLTEATVPESVLSIGNYAFYNSAALAKVNEYTTLSDVLSAFVDAGANMTTFMNTALCDNMGDITVTSDPLEIVKEDGDNTYRLYVEVKPTSSKYYDEDGRLLTGENAQMEIGISRVVGTVSDTLRVYFQFEGGSPTSDTTKIFGYELDKPLQFNASDGAVVTGTFHASDDVPGCYYLEFSDIDAGDTMNLNLSVTYENYITGGGTMLVWIDNECGKELPTEVNTVKWDTVHDDFSVSDYLYTIGNIIGDGTAEGAVTVKSLKYNVALTHPTTISSYGKDVMTKAIFTDTLHLPDYFEWKDGVLEAIQAGNYRAVNDTYSLKYYVTLEEDGESKEYCLASISKTSSLSTSDVDMKVVDGEVQLIWAYNNKSTKSEISQPTFRITYSDDLIVADVDGIDSHIISSADTLSCTFTNEVVVDQIFTYGDSAQATSSGSVTKAIGKSDFTFNKTVAYSDERMSAKRTYYLRLKNSTTLPFTALECLKDPVPTYFYIKPADMETMFYDDTYGSLLTITIYRAQFCTAAEQTVTATDGNTYTIDCSDIYGADAEHDGAETVDDCKIAGAVKTTIEWSEDKTHLNVTVAYGDVSDTYTVGTDCQYATIEELFDDIDLLIVSDTQYSCNWDLEGVVLYSGETKEFSIPATAKSGFMNMTADTRNICKGVTAYNYAYAYYDNVGAQTNKNSYAYSYVYADFRLDKTASIDGKALDSDDSISAGDIVTYSNTVAHLGGTAYDALPLVDRMTGGQVLIVRASDNTALAEEGLPVMSFDDEEYYILNKEGTYNNITVGNYLADTVTVSSSSNGMDTLIYWYLNLPTSKAGATVNYQALVSPTYAGIDTSDGIEYELQNTVWLGDHESHRLYDYAFFTGTILSTEKYIVTNAEDEITSSHDYTKDELEKNTLIDSGDKVTYRFTINVRGDDESIIISGNNMYDTLPGSLNNYWSKDNISVSYVAGSSSAFLVSDESEDAWYIEDGTADSEGKTQQTLRWNSDFFIQVKGTSYIYVTLEFPTEESQISHWSNYCHAYLTDLTNTWHLYQLKDEVSHTMSICGEVLLQKGVMSSGTRTSGYPQTYSANSAVDSLLSYSNDTSADGEVVYYITLFNGGDSKLYLTEIQDVLPKGFTFQGLYYYSSNAYIYTKAINSTYYNSTVNIIDVKTGKIAATYKKGTIYATTSVNDNGNQVITFTFDNNTYGSNLSLDSARGMYYLKPGEALVIAYYCDTNGYSDSDDAAENTVAMPFYDYNSGGVILTENYAATLNTTKITNDGNSELTTNGQVKVWGMNTEKTDNSTVWIASQVTLYRGTIIPGITKEAGVSQAYTTETVPWTVTVMNSGSEAMRDYTVTDIMMAPYQFTGDVTYSIKDGSGNTIISDWTLFTFNDSKGNDLRQNGDTEVTIYSSNTSKSYTLTVGGESVTFAAYSLGNITVSLNRDSSGREILSIRFLDETRAAVPSGGGKGILKLNTKNYSNVNENKIFVNDCYLTPTSQNFHTSEVVQGICTPYDATNDGIYNPTPSITSEAQVPVSFGYATTSEKSVTELDDDRAVTSNSSTSNSSTNYIVLTDRENLFRYGLKVSNTGGTNSSSVAMNLFVLVDNLPQVGDHTTFYEDYPRYSEFQVDFASLESLDFAVTVTSGGEDITLSEDQYTLQFSSQTELDYDVGNNSKIWRGKDLTADDGWYTLDELRDGSASIDDMRSFRVVIIDEDTSQNLMPADAIITVSFNAKVNEDSDPTYSQVAWNSFGYLYSVGNNTLRAAPLKVGVKIPGVPFLEKTLTHDDGTTYNAERDSTFTFLIYEGTAQTFADGCTAKEAIAILAENDIPFTVTTMTVKEGESTAEAIPLDNLKVYSYNTSDETWSPTDKSWTWENNKSYTFFELTAESDSDYYFGTVNGNRPNNYTFTFSPRSSDTISFANIRKEWNISLLKTDDFMKNFLVHAYFGLYSTSEQDAISTDDYKEISATMDEAPQKTLVIDDVTWYLKDIKKSGDDGMVQFTHLTGDSYYLLELQAPEGYVINSEENGQLLSSEDGVGTVNLTVVNHATYELPNSGGSGTFIYYVSGALMVLSAGLSFGYSVFCKKKRERRKR